MNSRSISGHWASLMVVAVVAGACGGTRGPAAGPAAPALPPIIAREADPDPVPTITAACDQDFTAADARPVTATTVGHYFIDNGGLVYLVFVRGTPAWYGEMSNWQIAPTAAGQTTRPVGIGGFNYDLALDPGTRTLTVLDQRVDLQKTNVIFMDRVGTGLVVRGGELMNLCWPSRPDAVGQVLSRSPAAVTFVTGIAVPPPKPPPARTPTPPRTRRR